MEVVQSTNRKQAGYLPYSCRRYNYVRHKDDVIIVQGRCTLGLKVVHQSLHVWRVFLLGFSTAKTMSAGQELIRVI